MVIQHILQQLNRYNLSLHIDGEQYDPNPYGWVKETTTDEDISAKSFVTYVEMLERVEQYRKQHQLSDADLLVHLVAENVETTPNQNIIVHSEATRIIIHKVQQNISIVSMSPNGFSTSCYYMSDYATWIDHILLLVLFRTNHPESSDHA